MLRKYVGMNKLEDGNTASTFLLDKFHTDKGILERYRIDDTAQKIMADID